MNELTNSVLVNSLASDAYLSFNCVRPYNFVAWVLIVMV